MQQLVKLVLSIFIVVSRVGTLSESTLEAGQLDAVLPQVKSPHRVGRELEEFLGML